MKYVCNRVNYNYLGKSPSERKFEILKSCVFLVGCVRVCLFRYVRVWCVWKAARVLVLDEVESWRPLLDKYQRKRLWYSTTGKNSLETREVSANLLYNKQHPPQKNTKLTSYLTYNNKQFHSKFSASYTPRSNYFFAFVIHLTHSTYTCA